ncbi:MAG: TIGR02281 family clan AA aspartic protease [Alicycliphilus sp.]|jgi:aspartyl protease family protein|uniref:TIGR02281 family clan AA aspartic protease n=1 Tax=Diaphorobacter limosus TaxID=3036128 RepID=A0ABZ0J5A4_9BURK|nr:TIGR02281 family clan AA aspartic protease [Diaphorobacter sp. Y-1]MBP7329006.1 TIGR02281 family clan AA aspartic protease [Alicycliphilus sp.]WOO32874.1 TIGR02281 family clan AA aspartic protease [Diaphorobacter sp. Y-1]
MRYPLTCLSTALAFCLPAQVQAQDVALAGILGGKALLVVNGSAPRGVAPGESHMGVQVVSVGREDAVVDSAGGRRSLRLGEAPVRVGGSGTGQRVVLKADARGHFVSSGQINGRIMQYMVDTGASTIAIGRPDAERMGLKFEEQGQSVRMNTANGVAQGWRLRLDSVRVGDVELRGVDAIVTPQPMPYVLLGNSFLREFEMSRNGDEMMLLKRR